MAAAQEQTGRFERLQPYLRQSQISALEEEKRGIESTLQAPGYVQNQIQDRGAMQRQIRAIDRQLQTDAPRPYGSEERDAAVKRERELREKIREGMPSQAEMRRNPAGATDKHRAWEKARKADVLEWKNVRVRMHASGMIDGVRDAQDVANIETFRPAHASHELNMDNAQIPGKDIYLPQGPIAVRNVMSDEDRQAHLSWVQQEVDRQVDERMAALEQKLEALKAQADVGQKQGNQKPTITR